MDKLNCLGDFCPVPALKTKARLDGLQPGESLTVLVDHSCSVGNIREIVKNLACSIEVREAAIGIWEIVIVKK